MRRSPLLLAVVGRRAGGSRSWLGAVSCRRIPTLVAAAPEPLARELALGFDNLLADVYWMRAVVYYGGKRRADADASALAPQLRSAVSAARPGDVARPAFQGRVSLRRDLPDRGVSERPRPARPGHRSAAARHRSAIGGRWEYMHDIGFVHYWWLRDFQKAAEWFKRAGEQPGAPAWLAPLAATTLAEGGDRAVVALSVDADAAERRRRLAAHATPAIGCSSSMRWTRSTS